MTNVKLVAERADMIVYLKWAEYSTEGFYGTQSER